MDLILESLLFSPWPCISIFVEPLSLNFSVFDITNEYRLSYFLDIYGGNSLYDKIEKTKCKSQILICIRQ